MKIIFFGPPGSGKGTQAKLITKKFNIFHISPGDILRKEISKKTTLGKIIQHNMNHGKLIDDNIILDLVQKKINQKKFTNGFILDGVPRTIIQAKEIEKKNIYINYIIEFILPLEKIYERILGRRIHKESGRTYHIKYHPPKIKNRDDITNDELTIRKDDNIHIINTRLFEYQKMKTEIIKFYDNKIKKKKIRYYKINAAQKIEKIYKEIKENLQKI
ncbi:adenylate kinase family protein [Buchnera aphidicola]|uniref:adenylate kinase family protein n=1 Tax=Buchnera aphidicola TaxID=9 RepID=UPI0031B89EA8